VNDPILVTPKFPIRRSGETSSDEVAESLIEDLRAEGLDARIAHEEGGYSEGGAPFDQIVLWVADAAGQGVVGAVIAIAIDWMRRRHRQYPGNPPQPKFIDVVLYEGDKGRTDKIITVPSADDPIIRTSPKEDFENYTRRKPAEGPRRRRRG